VGASPSTLINTDEPVSPARRELTMSPVVVHGVHTGIPVNAQGWDYPVRLDWEVFAQNLYYVTLFAKALEKLQAESEDITIPLSYYQIAGIRPFGFADR